jgi:hypothetical protein
VQYELLYARTVRLGWVFSILNRRFASVRHCMNVISRVVAVNGTCLDIRRHILPIKVLKR